MKNIKNIIFDLGGVLFPINGMETLNRFQNNGLQQVRQSYEQLIGSKMFELFETGKISPQEFRDGFNNMFGLNIDNKTFDECWNAMIVGYPETNNPYLESLKARGYNLYVLSNTNKIHVDYLEPMSQWREGLFNKIYYSNDIHFRKPDLECFRWVIEDAGIRAEETVFIDDRDDNIEGAKASGLNTICLKNINELIETLDKFLK